VKEVRSTKLEVVCSLWFVVKSYENSKRKTANGKPKIVHVTSEDKEKPRGGRSGKINAVRKSNWHNISNLI